VGKTPNPIGALEASPFFLPIDALEASPFFLPIWRP